jgi:hypothetical protein
MLPCYQNCAYRRSIPGDCHSQCARDWTGLEIPRNDNPRVQHWFLFPLNFDPVWGPDECQGYDREGGHEATGLASILLGLLGGR